MAIVLKSNMETESTAAHAAGTPTILNIITKKTPNQAQIAEGNILWNILMISYLGLNIFLVPINTDIFGFGSQF